MEAASEPVAKVPKKQVAGKKAAGRGKGGKKVQIKKTTKVVAKKDVSCISGRLQLWLRSNWFEFIQQNKGLGRGARSQISKEKSELSGGKVGDFIKQRVIVPPKNPFVVQGITSSQHDSEID